MPHTPWQANDDLLLKEGMQNIGDYASIAKGVKFSYKFTKEEIEARWTAILFHPIHSRYSSVNTIWGNLKN